MKFIQFTILFLFLFNINGTSQIYDIDSNSYHLIQIKNQFWLNKNLNVAHFRNGDTIPECKTKEEWMFAEHHEKPAWCYFQNDKNTSEKIGKLYKWYAVNDPRGITPDGYHIPTKAELDSLTDHLDTIPKKNSKLYKNGGAGKKLRSTTGWDLKYNSDEKGINEVQFNAFPTGNRHNGLFVNQNSVSIFWVDEIPKKSTAYAFKIFSDSDICFNLYRKGSGFAVRCIKDKIIE